MIRNWVFNCLRKWVHSIIASRPPDQRIGGRKNPYLLRWKIIDRKLCGIYIHIFLRSDSDVALHDHPKDNVSVILKGGYIEWMPEFWIADPPRQFIGSDLVQSKYWPINRKMISHPREEGDIVWRRAAKPHRIQLYQYEQDIEGPMSAPCTTLWIVGPSVREWGFHCPRGWRPWKEFTNYAKDGNSESVGKGCAE